MMAFALRCPGARSARWLALPLLTLALLLQGCATSPMHTYYYGDRSAGLQRSNLIDTNERAADALLEYAPLDASQPVLVATLVHVDRLTESSRLGRMFSEQIAGRMVQRGLKVTEVNDAATDALTNDEQQIQAVARTSGDDILDQMVSSLQSAYGVSINRALAEQSLAR